MTEQEYLQHIDTVVSEIQRSNEDLIKILNGGIDQVVELLDGSVVQSLNNRVNNLTFKIVNLTQEDYDALPELEKTKDNVLYVITGNIV